MRVLFFPMVFKHIRAEKCPSVKHEASRLSPGRPIFSEGLGAPWWPGGLPLFLDPVAAF